MQNGFLTPTDASILQSNSQALGQLLREPDNEMLTLLLQFFSINHQINVASSDKISSSCVNFILLQLGCESSCHTQLKAVVKHSNLSRKGCPSVGKLLLCSHAQAVLAISQKIFQPKECASKILMLCN